MSVAPASVPVPFLLSDPSAATADFSMASHKPTGVRANTTTGGALSQAQSHLNDMATATGDYAMESHKLTGLTVLGLVQRHSAACRHHRKAY